MSGTGCCRRLGTAVPAQVRLPRRCEGKHLRCLHLLPDARQVPAHGFLQAWALLREAQVPVKPQVGTQARAPPKEKQEKNSAKP